MRQISRLLLLALFVALGPMPSLAEDSCKCAAEILEAVGQIKPGQTRSALDPAFEEDGGWQVAANTRYIYKKCPYIKIDVEFAGDEINKRGALSNDKIVKISKPYLEYPAKD